MAQTNKQRAKERWQRFGEFLKSRREALLEYSDIYTQGFVAEQAGLTRQTYNSIEGGRPTKPDTIEKIAAALSIDPQEAMHKAGFAPDPKALHGLSPLKIAVLTDLDDLPEDIRRLAAVAIRAVASQCRATRAARKLDLTDDPDHTYNHADPPLVTRSEKDVLEFQSTKGVHDLK